MLTLVSFIEMRFVLASFLMLVFSLKRVRSPLINVFLVSAILLLAYGLNNLIILLSLFSLNIVLIYSASHLLNEYSFIMLNLALLYCYKMFGKYLEPRIASTFDISGCIMILTIKMTYLRRDIRVVAEEGTGKSTGNEVNSKHTDGSFSYLKIFFSSRSLRGTKYPAFSDFIRYLFFIPSLLSGPAPSFASFVKVNTTAKTPFPFRHFALTMLCMLLYGVFKSVPFIGYILDPKSSFAAKIIAVHTYNIISRMKFHFIWNLAHCCFLLNNIPDLLNIDFYKVECTESVREISANWNRFVSNWVKEFFFVQLKNHSMKSAVIVAHLASAILHGVNTCYLLFTLSFGIFSPVITRVNLLIPFKIARQLQMVFFVSYFSMPFYLLDINELYRVWKALYFYGHVYCGSLMIIFGAIDVIKRLKLKAELKKKIEVKSNTAGGEKTENKKRIYTNARKTIKCE